GLIVLNLRFWAWDAAACRLTRFEPRRRIRAPFVSPGAEPRTLVCLMEDFSPVLRKPAENHAKTSLSPAQLLAHALEHPARPPLYLCLNSSSERFRRDSRPSSLLPPHVRGLVPPAASNRSPPCAGGSPPGSSSLPPP